MWDERHVLDSLLWEAAVDDMGIYPRSTVRDGVETQRTERQDGWNEAVMAMTKKHGVLTAWAAALTNEQLTPVRVLLDADGEPLHLGLRDGAVVMFLNFSDTFGYASADAERVTLDDLPEIARLWQQHGYYGTVAWAAQKRREEPVKEIRYDALYLAAKADVRADPARVPERTE